MSPLITGAAIRKNTDAVLAAISSSANFEFVPILLTIDRGRIWHIRLSLGCFAGCQRHQDNREWNESFHSFLPSRVPDSWMIYPSLVSCDLGHVRMMPKMMARRNEVSQSMALAPYPPCEAGCNASSGLAATYHRNDHISLFMPLLDIAVRLDDLLQRIDPVNDRFELARLDQSFEHEQVFELVAAV